MGRATRGIIPRHTIAVVISYNAFLLKITVVYKVEMSRLRCVSQDMTLYLSSRPKHAMHAKWRDLLWDIHMVGMSPFRYAPDYVNAT